MAQLKSSAGPPRSETPAKTRSAPSLVEASSSKPDVYVFFGHGWETLTTKFEDREKLEDGYTLITFTECGMPTRLPDMVPVVRKMTSENLPILSKIGTDKSKETIEAVKKTLGKDIRVYKPGEEYPDLLYASFGAFYPPTPDTKGAFYSLYVKSGVHKAPFVLPETGQWKINCNVARHKPTRYTIPIEDVGEGIDFVKYCSMSPTTNLDAARNTYTGAVFPNPNDKDGKAYIDQIMEKQKKNANGELGEDEDADIFFRVKDVMKAIGPGVYYWPICRGTIEGEPSEVVKIVEETRSKSNARQKTRAGKRRHNRHKTYRKKRRY